jgi:hypothetical protein
MIISLRRVLESAESGMGLSQSLVRELGTEGLQGEEVARKLLLGFPLSTALRPLAGMRSEEVAMLSSLVVSSTASSATLVGTSGKELARTLERWVKIGENRRLEQRVLRFRSVITAGVLGAVTAMVATLGPVVGSLSFTGQDVQGAASVLPAAALMTALSSGMLGFFMSGRKMFVNVLVAMAAFAAVGFIASPLASIPPLPLWGVK